MEMTKFEKWMASMSVEERSYAIAQLPSHLIEGKSWNILGQVLSDLEFLHAKVNAGLAYPLIQDYDFAEKALKSLISHDNPIYQAVYSLLVEFASAYNQEFHTFQNQPSITGQQVFNNLYRHNGDFGKIGELLSIFSQQAMYPERSRWLRRVNFSHQTKLPRALLRTRIGHNESVICICTSPNGKYIVTGGIDGTICLWQWQDGALIQRFTAHQDGVTALVWIGDEEKELELISGGRDQYIRRWNIQSGVEISSWRGHTDAIRSLKITKNQQELISCGDDRIIRVWQIETGQEIRSLRGHLGRVLSLAADESGQLLLSGSEDNTLRQWDIGMGQWSKSFRGHTDDIHCVEFDKTERYAVSGSDDGTAIVWDIQNGQALISLRGHREKIRGISVVNTADGGLVVITGSYDETLRIWQLKPEQLVLSGITESEEIENSVQSLPVLSPQQTWTGAIGGINVLVKHPYQMQVLSGGQDGSLRFWSIDLVIEATQIWREHQARINELVVIKGYIASASSDQTIRIWDSTNYKHRMNLRGHLAEVTALTVVDKQRLVSASADHTLCVWEYVNGALQSVLGSFKHNMPTSQTDPSNTAAHGHSHAVISVVGLDNKHVVSAAKDRTLRVWNVDTGKQVAIYQATHGLIENIIVVHEKNLIIGAGTGCDIFIWTLDSGELRHTIRGHSNSVSCLALVEENQLITGSLDHTIRVWDLETYEEIMCLGGDELSEPIVAIVADEDYILAATLQGNFQLWDIFTQTQLYSQAIHAGYIRCLKADLPKRLIYSGGDDFVLAVTDFNTGEVYSRAYVGSPITSLAPIDNNRVCIGTRQGEIIFFSFE